MRRRLAWLLLGVPLLVENCGTRKATLPEVVCQQVRLQLRRGYLKEALEQAAQGFQQWSGQPGSRAWWQLRLLKAEALLAQGRAREALPLLGGAPPAELAAALRLQQGHARFLLADYREAQRLLEEAAQLAPESTLALLRAEIRLRQGAVQTRQGDHAGAEQSSREALRLAAQHQDLYLQASALGNLGFRRLNGSRYDEAIPFFEQSLELAEKAGFRKLVPMGLGNLGRCHYRLGDFPKAVALLARAASLAGQYGDTYGRQIWLGALADAHSDQGQFPAAISYYEQALTLSRTLKEDYSTGLWLTNLTLTALQAGDLSRAQMANREALELSRRIQARDLQAQAALGVARIATARGDHAAAETAYREVMAAGVHPEAEEAAWEAEAGLAGLLVQTGRTQAAETAYRHALDSIEGTRTRLARDEWKLSFQASAIRFYRDYVEFLMGRGQVEPALEVAESCRARVLAQKLGRWRAGQPRATAAALRKLARSAGAVLLSFWLAPRRSFLWVVTAGGVEFRELPPESELKPLVEAHQGAIQSLRDPLQTDNPSSRRLSQLLLDPIAARAPPGSRVLAVGDGCLHEVNLETLPAPGGRARYWVEEVTLMVAPSLALPAGPRPAAPAGGGRLLLIGNPVPPEAEFPPLPDAEAELEGIRSRFPGPATTVFAGAAAHPGAYQEAQPGRFSMIHFSAHATANRDSPLDSAVILSRRGESFKLYARDVMTVPLRARLVTVSACRGAGARAYAGEGLVGFAWAFLQAGAGNVVAGLWDASDRSSARLMIHLYSQLAENQSVPEALRSAKLALVRSPGPYRKPYYWAPFQLFTRSPAAAAQ